MGKTKIAWTEETLNPTTGCDKVSPGCTNCYALDMAARLKLMGSPRYQNDGDPRTSGPGFGLTMHEDTARKPLDWKRPRLVFVNSMSDLFHPDVTSEFLTMFFDVMRDSPTHTFQVLTKRPQRMADWTYRYYDCDHGGNLTSTCPHCAPYPNVWLGTSIENDRYAFRADHLRNARAHLRFVSAEPLLGPLPSLDLTGIDWLIVGGESGPRARPFDLAWARDLRDRCAAAGTKFFMKQAGELWAMEQGVHATDRHGVDMENWPEDLRVQEMPPLAGGTLMELL